MDPTPEDFQPRRDGWFEHEGTWAEVTIGTVIGSRHYRTGAWEIIDQSHGKGQIPIASTLWMRARNLATGEERTVRPRHKTIAVTILTRDPEDTQTPPVTPPSDSEALELLVKELSPVPLAYRDEETGEITCPDLNSMDFGKREEIEHLTYAHGITVPQDLSLADVITLHGRAHQPKYRDVGKGGFPHRHANEDLSIFTNTRRTL